MTPRYTVLVRYKTHQQGVGQNRLVAFSTTVSWLGRVGWYTDIRRFHPHPSVLVYGCSYMHVDRVRWLEI
jgi:hypothetical protein